LSADLALALQQAGFDVLGPAATNAEAFALLAGARCDGAVLDVNLGAETSAPIAAMLTGEGVPVVTLTGYARHQLPPQFAATLVLSKPVQWRVLTHAVAEAVSAAKSAG
jgi:DNA-binding NarL/FixJ family response regulator